MVTVKPCPYHSMSIEQDGISILLSGDEVDDLLKQIIKINYHDADKFIKELELL